MPSQYDNIPSDAGGSWDGAEKPGVDMSRGPQLGYWLTPAAGVLALVGGALMLAMRDTTAAPPCSAGRLPPATAAVVREVAPWTPAPTGRPD